MVNLWQICVYLSISFGVREVVAINCNEQGGDGNYEIGCRSYVSCVNGVATTHDCEPLHVYNSHIQKCDSIGNVDPPCGLSIDCSGSDDKRYPQHTNSTDNCKAFYTCHGGRYLGHNYCPAGLVFDFNSQICNFDYNVCKPCGTVNCPSTVVG